MQVANLSGRLLYYLKVLEILFFIFKEILLNIGFIENMRITRGNKEVPQTFFHSFIYLRKYRFNPFDSVSLATKHFEISWHHKMLTVDQYW